ncbi:ribonuclease H-like domain-containing protein [Tanacetum coccineum]|uniref:Ribonuclease H-like domain-containing protein n=1 Tax=Tanacetum coccineum TaxID=301880 RepID=A0ABQ4WAY0_9ASTR
MMPLRLTRIKGRKETRDWVLGFKKAGKGVIKGFGVTGCGFGEMARECRSLRNQESMPRNHDNGNINQDSSRRTVNVEETSSKAMVAIDGAGFDWSFMAEEEVTTNMALMAFSDSEVYNDKTCSNTCLKSFETLKTQLDNLRVEFNKSEFNLATYKRGLASVEEQLVFYKKNEVMFSDQIVVLKRDASFKDSEIIALKSEIEKLKKEKEFRKGVGYNVVPPPPTSLFAPPTIDLSNSGLEEFQQPEFKGYGPKASKSVCVDTSNKVKKTPDTPLVEELVSDKEKKTVFPTKIEFGELQFSTKRANQANAVKASICWVWRPTKLDSASITLKKPNYFDARGISKHMIGNISYLLDFQEFDDMLPLVEESKEERSLVKILIKIPRKNNMYSVDMKNIVPKESLTCLVAKATLDESMLWHRRLGHNRVIIVKPHNKTPYELFRGRTPALGFMRPFGCHVSILNTLDHLGKFDGKSDDGFFVGYSLTSKAFRVYNIRTRRVEENLHIRFLEDKPIVSGDGPKWLFDLDSLTKSMNYVPVIAGTNSNDFAGLEVSIGEGSTSKETDTSQDYIVMPLWKDSSLIDSPSMNVSHDEPELSC